MVCNSRLTWSNAGHCAPGRDDWSRTLGGCVSQQALRGQSPSHHVVFVSAVTKAECMNSKIHSISYNRNKSMPCLDSNREEKHCLYCLLHLIIGQACILDYLYGSGSKWNVLLLVRPAVTSSGHRPCPAQPAAPSCSSGG